MLAEMGTKQLAALANLRGKDCLQRRRHLCAIAGVRQASAYAECFQAGCVVELVEEERRQKLRQAGAQALGRGANAAMMDERRRAGRQPL